MRAQPRHNECWSGVYFRLGAALLVPMLLLALLLLEGGAAEAAAANRALEGEHEDDLVEERPRRTAREGTHLPHQLSVVGARLVRG